MTRPTPSTLSGPAQAQTIADAIGALAAGRLIVFPTETVYGIAASAASPAALANLRRITAPTSAPTTPTTPGPISWHAPSRDLATTIIAPTHPVHRRLFHKLLPGPVTLIIELSTDRLPEIRAATSTLPSTIDDGLNLCLRVPDHADARALLQAAWDQGIPVVAESIAAAGWGDGNDPTKGGGRIGQLPADGEPALVIDEGPTRLGRPSTRIRLNADGSYTITSIGALDERAVRRALERTILFVCSGNTCRSPMAEHIARSLVGNSTDDLKTTIRSAGAFATGGDPITSESVEALRSLGIDTGPAKQHRSHELSRQMVADADAIFTMTQAHAREVRRLDPTAADRIHTLDPAGDIADPIGSAQEVYTRTAKRLKDLIEKRLAELGP